MLPALPKHVVGHGENPLGADGEASLLQRLALGAGEGGLAELQMAAGELPVSWITPYQLLGEVERWTKRAKDSPTP